MMSSQLSEVTRERVLRAAGEVFAERGFRDATVRDICGKAGVNVASVNYYFRNKEALYCEALSFAFEEAEERYPFDCPEGEGVTPAERLRHFIRNFLMRLLDDTHLGWHGKLITREILSPTAALLPIVDSIMKPRFDAVRRIVIQLVPHPLDDDSLERCVLSIFGQCLVYRHARSVIDQMRPQIVAGPEDREATAEHVFRFVLAALTHLPPTPGT